MKFGSEHAANKFTDNFQSYIVFKTSPLTMAWAQKRLGTTWSLIFSHKATGIDYRWGWSALAQSPLADPTHPGADYYRKRLRLGAGRAMDDRGSHGVGRAFDPNDPFQQMLTGSRGGEWKMQPLFLDAEADYLAENFVAVAEVMRGGVRRRDIIRAEPMYAIPDDMRQTDPESVKREAGAQPAPLEASEQMEATGGVKSKPAREKLVAPAVEASGPAIRKAAGIDDTSQAAVVTARTALLTIKP
jgi:hypothetical protein